MLKSVCVQETSTSPDRDAVSDMLRDGGGTALGEKVALVPAGSAGKVVYFATI